MILMENFAKFLNNARETAHLFRWLKSTEIECERHQKNKSSNNMDHSRVGGKSPYGGDTYVTILTTTFTRRKLPCVRHSRNQLLGFLTSLRRDGKTIIHPCLHTLCIAAKLFYRNLRKCFSRKFTDDWTLRATCQGRHIR